MVVVRHWKIWIWVYSFACIFFDKQLSVNCVILHFSIRRVHCEWDRSGKCCHHTYFCRHVPMLTLLQARMQIQVAKGKGVIETIGTWTLSNLFQSDGRSGSAPQIFVIYSSDWYGNCYRWLYQLPPGAWFFVSSLDLIIYQKMGCSPLVIIFEFMIAKFSSNNFQ